MTVIPTSVLSRLPVRWLFYLFGTGIVLIGIITAAGWLATVEEPLMAYRDPARQARATAAVTDLTILPTATGGQAVSPNGAKVRFKDETGRDTTRFLDMVDMLPVARQQEVLRKGAQLPVLFLKGEQTNAIPDELLAAHPPPPFNPWPSIFMTVAGIVLGVPFIVLGRKLTTERLRRMFPHGNV